jgi:integrase
MNEISVTEHQKNKKHVGYKKFVGGRNFHLVTGTSAADERRAKAIAHALVTRWDTIKQAGGIWTDEIVDECFRRADPAAHAAQQASPPPAMPAVPVADGPQTMLYDAIRMFEAAEWTRYTGKEMDLDQYNAIIQRINKAREGMPNVPMHEIGEAKLGEYRSFFVARPLTCKGKPMAVQYVVNVMVTMKSFFRWAKKQKLWVPPDDEWRTLLRVSPKKLRTTVEKKRKAKGHPKFKLRDLQILWNLALPRDRLMIGLGYWAGHTQKEISTLLREDVIERDGEVYIDRLRHKTEVPGYWWLPPEVAKLLKQEMARTPDSPEGYALLGRRGNPLVHNSRREAGKKGKRNDAIALMWERLMNRAAPYKVRRLSFKYLRKSMSQRIRDKRGREFSQFFLAQVRDTVADESYNQPSKKKLIRLTRKIHAECAQMFERPDWKKLLAEVETSVVVAA